MPTSKRRPQRVPRHNAAPRWPREVSREILKVLLVVLLEVLLLHTIG